MEKVTVEKFFFFLVQTLRWMSAGITWSSAVEHGVKSRKVPTGTVSASSLIRFIIMSMCGSAAEEEGWRGRTQTDKIDADRQTDKWTGCKQAVN